MNRSIIALIILVLLTFPCRMMGQDPEFPDKDRKITAVYNEKTDTTVVRFGPMHVVNFKTSSPFSYAIEDGELRLSAFFTYKGKTLVKPQVIGLIFQSVNEPNNRWELSQQKDLEIVADDKHWAIPDVRVVDSKRTSNLIIESLGISMPCETFSQIADAKKIKLRLGDRKFDFSKAQREALRDLAGRAGC